MGAERQGLVKPTAQAAKVASAGMPQQRWEGWRQSADTQSDAIVKPPKPQFRGVSQELRAARSDVVMMPKLVIGAPGDAYEQEADRVAEQVVQRLHEPEVGRSQSESTLQRETLPNEIEPVQMKPTELSGAVIAGGAASPDLVAAIDRARGSGQPLAAGLQHSMGQAMGADFSGVRVHTDVQADQLNRSIQARAFTTGQDVFFRQGAYEPESHSGQELIAHELTHVRQQGGIRFPYIQRKVSKYLQVGTRVRVNRNGRSVFKFCQIVSKDMQSGMTIYDVQFDDDNNIHRINHNSPNIIPAGEHLLEEYPMESQWKGGPRGKTEDLRDMGYGKTARTGIGLLTQTVDLNCGYYCAKALLTVFQGNNEQKIESLLPAPTSIGWSPDNARTGDGRQMFRARAKPQNLIDWKNLIDRTGGVIVSGTLGDKMSRGIMKLAGFKHYILAVGVNLQAGEILVRDPLKAGEVYGIPIVEFMQGADDTVYYYALQ